MWRTNITIKTDDCHDINFGLPKVQRLGDADLLDGITPCQVRDRARQHRISWITQGIVVLSVARDVT